MAISIDYMTACEKIYLGICFVPPSNAPGSSIFGFSEFVAGLALLAVICTVTDIRYRFRVEVAPLPLFQLTYALIGIIGIGTLLTEVWLSERWLVPLSLISHSMWQALLGFFFLALAMTWIFYAFIIPPIFSEKNYRKFAQTLYRIILKGSDAELPAIADELSRSAERLVTLCRPVQGSQEEEPKKHKPDVSDYAFDMLLLLGNRKLCRHLIASSPRTAIVFFDAVTANEKYNIPMGQFAQNITTEAILNEDSVLYHEDEGYRSGLIGYLKPFSQAIYGNYVLVESLAGGSPLDVHYEVVRVWKPSQLKAYSGAVLHTLKGYLLSGSWGVHSYALYRALKNIESSCLDVYKLNEIPVDYYSSDIYKRLQVAVDFVRNAIDLIQEQQEVPETTLRVREKTNHKDFYDHIAALMFEMIFFVSSVKGPPDKAWFIHYSAVWGQFFSFSRGKAWDIVQFKLCRLLYEEVRRLEEMPNYKSSAILGFCLNVLGLQVRKRKGFERRSFPLSKVILRWTQKNYLKLKTAQPDVAESCLIGSLSFDEQNRRLVKTYAKGLNLEAPKEYLDLESPDVSPPGPRTSS